MEKGALPIFREPPTQFSIRYQVFRHYVLLVLNTIFSKIFIPSPLYIFAGSAPDLISIIGRWVKKKKEKEM